MAYYQDDENDEQGQGMSQQGQQDQSQPQLSGQSSTIPTGIQSSAPAQQKQPKAAPASSGMGANFQNYTKANQGTAQDRLNASVAKNVSNQGQAAQSSINQANTAFGKKVDAGTLANRQTAVQDVQNTVNSARNLQAQARQNAVNTASVGLPQEQTGAPNLNKTPVAAQPAAAPADPLSQLEQASRDRFSEVINTSYKGPQSLRQSGDYQQAAAKVGTAQQALDNTKTALGREQLLKNMYQDRGDYTAGLNKLDAALLNANKTGVSNLQAAAAAQGNLGNKLDQAQIGSANTAQNRTNEINTIRSQAREAFSAGKTAEEAATEQRLKSVTDKWNELPDYFKNVIKNKSSNPNIKAELEAKFKADNPFDENAFGLARDNYTQLQQQAADANVDLVNAGMGVGTASYSAAQDRAAKLNQQAREAANVFQAQQAKKADYEKQLANVYNPNAVYLNPAEAAILGIQSGEGFYNLGENAIATTAADKQRLVSRNEQARQAALAALAGLDRSNQLDTNLLYNNADLAGTQTATDALNVAGTRAALNEAEKNFRTSAQGSNLTGYGEKKNKTSGKRYYASESANLGNLLENSGYDLDSAIGQGGVTNNDVLEAAARISQGQAAGGNPGIGVAGASDAYSRGIGNMGDGQSVPAGALDAFGSATFINPLTGLLGLGTASEALGSAANFVNSNSPISNTVNYNPAFMAANGLTNALGMGNLTNAIGGMFGGSSSKESKADAALFARQDLERQIKNSLASSGFQNRAGVVDTNTTNARLQALNQLLANLDKTNS